MLNKPFQGDWLDLQEHIGHEVIDFLLSDDDEYYVYNNPWGVCPKDIWVDGTKRLTRLKVEKYNAKYLVLAEQGRNSFQILYVIELDEKLHREHARRQEIRKNSKRRRIK